MVADVFLDQWLLGLRIGHRAHFEAAKHYERRHLTIGIPTVVISALMGTTVFANFEYSSHPAMKLTLAVLSVLMIVFSSLQAFLRYAERSERHRTAAIQLGEVRRELEELVALAATGTQDKSAIDTLRKKWDAVDRQAPTIPTRIYNRVSALIASLQDQQSAAASGLPEKPRTHTATN
jgi:hypothetical protein